MGIGSVFSSYVVGADNTSLWTFSGLCSRVFCLFPCPFGCYFYQFFSRGVPILGKKPEAFGMAGVSVTPHIANVCVFFFYSDCVLLLLAGSDG